MSAISTWSTTATNNNSSAPNGFPEGMPPSGVNDAAREVMAAVRTFYEGTEWRDLGHTPTRTGNTTFTVATDLTTIYVTNRPIKCTDSSTLYGYIVSSSYSSPNTTVTVALDSGNLSASLTAISLGPIPTNLPISVQTIRNGALALLAATNTWTGSNTWSGSNNFSGPFAFQGGVNYLAASGTDTYTATLSPAITSYAAGAEYNITIVNANTSTTPTLNLNSLGAKTIKREGGASLVANDMPDNHEAKFRYNGTDMILLNPFSLKLASLPFTEIIYPSQTASASATLDFNTEIDWTLNVIEFDFINVRPTNAGTILHMRVSKDAGSTHESGASDYAMNLQSYTSVAGTDSVLGTTTSVYLTEDAVGMTNAAGTGLNGTIRIFAASASAKFKVIEIITNYIDNAGNLCRAYGSGFFTDGASVSAGAPAINGVQFYMSGGTIADGTIIPRGKKNS